MVFTPFSCPLCARNSSAAVLLRAEKATIIERAYSCTCCRSAGVDLLPCRPSFMPRLTASESTSLVRETDGVQLLAERQAEQIAGLVGREARFRGGGCHGRGRRRRRSGRRRLRSGQGGHGHHEADAIGTLQQPKSRCFHGAHDTHSMWQLLGGRSKYRHGEPRNAHQFARLIDDVDAPDLASAPDVQRPGGAGDPPAARRAHVVGVDFLADDSGSATGRRTCSHPCCPAFRQARPRRPRAAVRRADECAHPPAWWRG